MQTAKVTSKGQVTIPAEVRKKLGLSEGSYVTFTEQGDAIVMTNASAYSAGGLQEFTGAQCLAEPQAAYDVEYKSQTSTRSAESFLNALEKWREDFEVADDNVAKVLNRRSRELPDVRKIKKIWG